MVILVVGATGLLGGEICRLLREDGLAVRGLVRAGSPREPFLARLGVEVVHGDLRDPEAVEAACRGQEAVVTTANSVAPTRRPGDSIRSVDRDGTLGLVDAARRAGVRRFVYVSVTPSAPSCAFVDAKRAVEAAVRASGLEWTTLQPSAFMDTLLWPRVGWDLARGRVTIIGRGDRPLSFIASRDVAAFAVRALERERPLDRALPLGGPEALTHLQAARIAQEVTGRPLRVRRVPALVARGLAVALRPLAPLPSSLMSMIASTADRGDVIDMTETLALLPVELTSLRDHFARAMPAGEP